MASCDWKSDRHPVDTIAAQTQRIQQLEQCLQTLLSNDEKHFHMCGSVEWNLSEQQLILITDALNRGKP